jgi:hypothetical protein
MAVAGPRASSSALSQLGYQEAECHEGDGVRESGGVTQTACCGGDGFEKSGGTTSVMAVASLGANPWGKSFLFALIGLPGSGMSSWWRWHWGVRHDPNGMSW